MPTEENGWDPEVVAFVDEMQKELSKGTTKYGKEDQTLAFLQQMDSNFELSCIVRYASRISRDDPRSEIDIIKIATYAYFYWKRHYLKK